MKTEMIGVPSIQIYNCFYYCFVWSINKNGFLIECYAISFFFFVIIINFISVRVALREPQ